MIDQNDQEPTQPVEKSIAEKYFSRFLRLIDFNLDLAVLLIKSWLTRPEEKEALSLQALGQHLEQDQFQTLFAKLTTDERQKWKNLIKGYMGVSDIKLAGNFISEEVTREMMSNSVNYDLEFFDLTSRYTVDHFVSFIESSPNHTGALFNALSPNTLAKILTQLPKEKASLYIEESFTTTITKNDPKYEALKKSLAQFIQQVENKPFTSKLLEMLPNYNPLKEKVIYASLFESIPKSDLIEVSRNNFPYVLFPKLPAEIMGEILKKYPENSRLNFLASLDEEAQSIYLEALAPKGAPLRDMLELSLQEIASNPSRSKAAKQSANDFTKNFITFSRKFLAETPEFSPIIHEILDAWIDENRPRGENVLKFKSDR